MRRYAIASVTVILLLAACGGSDDTLTKEEFIQQANAICKTGNDAIDAAGEEAFGDSEEEPDPAALEAFVTDTLVPNVRDQVEAVRALDEPKEDEDTINAILDDADEALDKMEDDPGSLIEAEEDPFASINERMGDYGVAECADADE